MAVSNPFGSGVGLDYYNYQPQVGFSAYLTQQGVTPWGNSPFDRYLRGSYDNLYSDYQTKLKDDPSMMWTDYLGKLDSRQGYNSLSPHQRGENPFNMGVKWQMPL